MTGVTGECEHGARSQPRPTHQAEHEVLILTGSLLVAALA